ncbi:uncharacterized protein LOC143026891 isoform X3 [Oratosquilla oratoria]|uniref:uncharacterized protein LOC143026891 isoform X3 n=1 Tax=Oratosquilla oratoria TaxID=337810 RepID=UPI003F759DD4
MSSSWTLRRRQKRKLVSYLQENVEDVAGSIASTSRDSTSEKDKCSTSLNDSEIPATEDEQQKVAQGFEHRWNFPHCVDALHGKHHSAGSGIVVTITTII